MRITHEHKPAHKADAFDTAGVSMKKILYWILVFLSLICVVCVGIIVIHWSINWRMS